MILFETSQHRFFDDGTTYYKEGGVNTGRASPWTVDNKQPDVAMVYFVWNDGTMSLADDEAQLAYQAYLAKLVVGAP